MKEDKIIRNLIKAIIGIAWLLVLMLAIFNPAQIAWKMGFIFLWLFITWIAYEIKHVPTVPDDEYYERKNY